MILGINANENLSPKEIEDLEQLIQDNKNQRKKGVMMFEHVAKSILEISLLSIVAIILVMIVRAVFGTKLKIRMLGVLWMLVLIRLVLPVTLNSPVQLGNILGFREPVFERIESNYNEADFTADESNTATNDMNLENKSDTQTVNAADGGGNDTSIITTQANSIITTPQMPIHINKWHVALGIWVAGVIVFLFVNLYRMFVFKKKMSSGKTLVVPTIQHLVDTNKAKLGLSQNISIKECQYTIVPVVTGFKHPVILLPKGLSNTIDLGKLDKIILHEMCHIKRNDLVRNYLWLVARALHWFNPLIWFAYKAYLNDIENACDETVLEYLSSDEVYEYSEALIEIVKRSKKITCAPALVSLCKNKSELRKRVINMMNPQKKSKTVSIIAVLMMAVIVIGCFTTACTSEPQEVSTAPTPDAVVQPIKDSDVETSADKTSPEEQQEISEDVLQALQKYAINNEQTFEYQESEDYFGDKILYFFGDDITLYRLFESDLSLKALGTKTYDVNLPIEISEEEAKNIIIGFAKKYWPDMEPEITKLNYEEEAGYFKTLSVEGVLKNTYDQSKQPFHGTVNGKGELISIGRTPNIDIEQCIADGTAMTLEQAKEHAFKHLEDEIGSINIEKLKTVTEKLDSSYELYTVPIYIFEFEYRTDHPTNNNFDYDAYVAVKPSTGEFAGLSVEPITDNIDVLSMEEAEQIAKEYIVSNYNQELEDITTTYRQKTTFSGKLSYSLCFDYGEDDGCSITVSAETGEITGIGH